MTTLSVNPEPFARPWLVATVVAVAFFMETLDSTVLVTALPAIAQTFHTQPVALTLGLTVYMVAAAILLPASGWCADRYGARGLFCAAILLFTAASVLCGVSREPWEFFVARAIQGAASAMMSPVGRLIVLRTTPKSDLLRAVNLMTFPGLAGPIVGPALGGFITTYVSWRWIFLINLPLGLSGWYCARRFIAESTRGTTRPLDAKGLLLNASALTALLYGMDLLAGARTAWSAGACLIGAGVAGGAIAWQHARRTSEPLVGLAPFDVRSFSICNVGGAWFRLTMAVPTFVLPLFLQIALGMNAFRAGLLILAHAAGDLVTKAATTQTMRRYGFRSVLVWSAVGFVLLTLPAALFTVNTPWWWMLAVLFVSGVIRSLQLTAINTLQFADIEAGHLTDASTLANVVQQVMRAISVGVAAIVLGGAAFLRGAATPERADFQWTIVFMSVAGLVALLWYVPASDRAGAHVSGHH